MISEVNGLRSSLEQLDDTRLIEGFRGEVARHRGTTAAMLVYIEAIDRRRAYLADGYSSTFAFCVERFHLSESQAGKSIHVARAGRRFPALFDMVARGEMHLSGANKLVAHLTEENHQEVLARARFRTTDQILALVAEISPRPDVPASIRALPRGAPPAPSARRTETATIDSARGDAPLASESAPGAPAPRLSVAEPAEAPAAAAQGPAVEEPPPATVCVEPRGRMTPLAPRRYKIEITVGEETKEKLTRLQALLSTQIPGGDLAVIIDRAVGELLDRTLARKAGVTERPRARRKSARAGRHIPAEVRREVWERDGGRCAYVGGDGHRCRETRDIEYHHREPYARGGGHEAANVELRCRGHNQHEADVAYGKLFMDGKRRGESARESVAPYVALAPKRVRVVSAAA